MRKPEIKIVVGAAKCSQILEWLLLPHKDTTGGCSTHSVQLIPVQLSRSTFDRFSFPSIITNPKSQVGDRGKSIAAESGTQQTNDKGSIPTRYKDNVDIRSKSTAQTLPLHSPIDHTTSATTLISFRNTRVFRTALTALTEPRTLWRRITRCPLPTRQVALHTYSFTLWWCLRTIRRTRVLHSSQGLQLCRSRLHNAWRC